MKCPNCGYIHGSHWIEKENGKETFEHVEGKQGQFYQLPIELQRYQSMTKQTMKLVGCPFCMTVFMDRYG